MKWPAGWKPTGTAQLVNRTFDCEPRAGNRKEPGLESSTEYSSCPAAATAGVADLPGVPTPEHTRWALGHKDSFRPDRGNIQVNDGLSSLQLERLLGLRGRLDRALFEIERPCLRDRPGKGKGQ